MYTVFAMLGLYAVIKRKKLFCQSNGYVIGDHGYCGKRWYNLKLFPYSYSFKTLI